MYKFRCFKCGKPQYSANREKIKEPCIYCGHNELFEEELDETEKAKRDKVKWHFTYAPSRHTGE
jgi:predicted  nucleic acid-binding Zn-ribbon protein